MYLIGSTPQIILSKHKTSYSRIQNGINIGHMS